MSTSQPIDPPPASVAPGAAPATPPTSSATATPRTLAHVHPAVRRPPRARPYLRLLLLIPSLAMLGYGFWAYNNVSPGGTVESIKLTTKPGPVGQANEMLRPITGTYDLYLKVKTSSAGDITTQTYKDIAIGSDRVWHLPRQFPLGDIREVDVWDYHWYRKDKNIDHITMNGNWNAEGQTFRIELLGKANAPPTWALPILSVGATLTGLVVLRFVWDQVV